MKKSKLRNSLAVRLNDDDYERFMKTTGKKYSDTLRELINAYSALYDPEDGKLKVKDRVQRVIRRRR